MDIEFVNGAPALFVVKERLLVVGDLHIGRDAALRSSGIHVPDATRRLLDGLLEIYMEKDAEGIVLLGDVKESISYPSKDEYYELQQFFHGLRGLDVTIAKGNHDARIAEILQRLDSGVKVEKEVLLEGVALIHGHALPSQEAMMKKYVVTAHSHPAVEINGRLEKAWAVFKIGDNARKLYKKYNRNARLVIMPAFNELITGRGVESAKAFQPLLKRGIFRPDSIKVYDLRNRRV